MLLMLNFIINVLFINYNNPLIMGIMILLQTLNISIMMGKIYFSFWFSYIIFLVFIGGVFVLFFYMIALSNNNKFNTINIYYFIMFLFLMLIYSLNINNLFYMNMENQTLMMANYDNYFNLMKFYNMPNMMINLLMVNMLFLMLIIVVYITNNKKGNLRLMIK